MELTFSFRFTSQRMRVSIITMKSFQCTRAMHKPVSSLSMHGYKKMQSPRATSLSHMTCSIPSLPCLPLYETPFADLKAKHHEISVFWDGASHSSNKGSTSQISICGRHNVRWNVNMAFFSHVTWQMGWRRHWWHSEESSLVWRYVRSGKVCATTPLVFHDLAVQRNHGTHIKYVSKETILEKTAAMEAHWDTTLPMANTHRSHHFIKPTGVNHLC